MISNCISGIAFAKLPTTLNLTRPTHCKPYRTSRLTFCLQLMLLTVLVALIPLAYAMPPDPVWISGFFDNGDSDDAVFLITSSTATLDPFPHRDWCAFPLSCPAHVLDDRRINLTRSRSEVDVRAPPVS